MAKKLRLLGFISFLLVIVLVLVVSGFIYFQKQQNVPVQQPTVSKTNLLKLADALTSANLTLEAAPFEQNGTITASVSGRRVLFSTRKDLKTQVQALQLITGKLKMDPQPPKEIDLRFDKVVVRF